MSTTGVADSGHDVKEQAKGAAQQARDQVQEAAGKARGRVRIQVDERSTEAGDRVISQAGDMQSVGAALREQGNTGAADVADQAALRIERVGTWLRDSDAEQMLEQAENTARRNPWAVLAGSVATGVAISRVLKASSRERYRARTATDGAASDAAAPSTDRTSTGTRSGRFERGRAATGDEVGGEQW